jgi:hypothetical protein
MFVAGNDSRVVIWSLSSGDMLQKIYVPSAGFISCLAWIKLLDSWIRQLESDVRNYELQCYRAYKHTWSPMSETKEH